MNLSRISKLRMLACTGLLAAPHALHAQNPLYSPASATLSIPSIDVAEPRGGYHNALLEFVSGDLWRLRQITPATEIAGVERVRVVKTDTFPVQVFLEIEGVVGNICSDLHLEKRLVGTTFHVSIQQERSTLLAACIAVAADFSWIVPLEVYGLPAGEYRYVVNRGMGPRGSQYEDLGIDLIGSFSLAADNMFPRAAPAFPGLINPEVTQLQFTPR